VLRKRTKDDTAAFLKSFVKDVDRLIKQHNP
jgi:hypothetical protein